MSRKIVTGAVAILGSLLLAGLAVANPFVSASDPHGILDFRRPFDAITVGTAGRQSKRIKVAW